MSYPLTLRFEDFKRLSGNNRIYYFEGESFVDLHFLVDGTIIKTTIIKDDIENPEAFFSDKMFTGAMKLTFRIPNTPDDKTSIVEVPKSDGNLVDISLLQDVEMKPQDIQRKGVDEEDTI